MERVSNRGGSMMGKGYEIYLGFKYESMIPYCGTILAVEPLGNRGGESIWGRPAPGQKLKMY